MAAKTLIGLAFSGLAAIAVATGAKAQDTALAGCIKLDDCSLMEAAVTVSAQQANFDLVDNYGSVDAQPLVDDLPQITRAEDGPGAVFVSSSKPEFLSYSGAAEFYVNGINLSDVVESRALHAYGPWGTPKYPDAFSYSFNDRWRFKANPMDDSGPALKAIAAGTESNPEDLLWHLSDPDFSVNLLLVRAF